MNDNISKRLDEAFAIKPTLKEETIKANVKKDQSTANISGQAKTPGDIIDQQKLQSGDIELEDIIDKINALRAGHSLKDKEIALSLEEYFTGLDVAEKTALFTYMKALSEIVSGIKPGSSAVEPDDNDPDVEMKKQNISSIQKSNDGKEKKQQSVSNSKKANVVVNKQSQAPIKSDQQLKKFAPIVAKQ